MGLVLNALFLLVFLAIGGTLELGDGWTFVDQEQDDDNSTEGSGEFVDKLNWITFSRHGKEHPAGSAEVQLFVEYVASQPTLLGKLETGGKLQMEDGPAYTDPSKHGPSVSDAGTESPTVVDDKLHDVISTNYYPEYAVGVLDNGCTAFLVGPQHALTAAHCVYNYNTSTWSTELDFWRGRNAEEYLQKMEWKHVIIPYHFHSTGDDNQNWALVEFSDESPVWLRLAYSESVQNIPLTVYGYLQDREWETMYYTMCRSDSEQLDTMDFAIQCESDQVFTGGPVLRGHSFLQNKMPVVYGVNIGRQRSFAHPIVHILSDLFWFVCYSMQSSYFDPHCGSVN